MPGKPPKYRSELKGWVGVTVALMLSVQTLARVYAPPLHPLHEANTAGCCRRWITLEATFLYLLLPGVGLLCGRRRRAKLSSLVTAVTKRLNLGQAAAAQRDAPALWNVCPSYAV